MDYFVLLNDVLKIIVGVSILFVWVIRYNNIIEEFKVYQLPEWLRDIVGIFKISFAVMLQTESADLVMIGSGGIAVLMVAAIYTHVRVKTPYFSRIPAFVLLLICIMLFSVEYSLL
tara:strand:+ start:1912 stop:2259 length:348 start_codon:yes stop_codon:yes gene_type:complete